MKLFYRVEYSNFSPLTWSALPHPLGGAYHDTIESAREYLAKQLSIDEAIRKEKPWTPKTKYRITDHLGAIHWPEERKAA